MLTIHLSIQTPMDNNKYIGNELDLFSHAVHWKNYWAKIIKPYLGARILDVGAGIGATAQVLSQLKCEHYLALEPDADFVNRMQRANVDGFFNSSFECLAGRTENLGMDDYFDTILYIDVLEHIENDKNELAQVAKHLLPGGYIVILSPAHQWLYTPFDKAVGHIKRYDKKSILLAKPENLIVERICYLDSVGLLASLGNRLIIRSSTPNKTQITIWDNWFVPCSTVVDMITRYKLGKSILGVFRAPI